MDSDQIIGQGLGLVLNELLDSGDKPEIRISGFRAEEIYHALLRSGLNAPDTPVMVLVSGSPGQPLGDILAEQCFTDCGRTATYGRNHNRAGLVYFQTSRESDSQSTRTMYHLRDSDFFEDRRWRHLVAGLIPEGVQGTRLPDALETRIELFLEAYTQTRRMQIRPFANFLVGIGEAWQAQGAENVDAEWAAKAIVDAMPCLGLFRSRGLARALESGKMRPVEKLLKRIINASRLVRSSGAELKRDALLRRVETATFGGQDSEDMAARRELVTAFIENSDDQARKRILFEDFSEILSTRKKKRELGSEVLEFLEETDPDVLELFKELDLTQSLDAQDSDAARELFLSPVFRLLESDLQKQVKRLMPRRERHDNVLIGLIETLDQLLDTQVSGVTISLGTGPEDSPGLRVLFCFLYGPALLELVASTGNRLRVGDVLSRPVWKLFEEWQSTSEDEHDEDEDEVSDDLAGLTVTVSVDGGDVSSFVWQPESPGMWMLWVQAIRTESFRVDPTARGIVSAIEDATAESLARPVEELSTMPQMWTGHRLDILDKISSVGITSESVNRLVELYTASLESVTRRDNPNLMSELRAMLTTDCVLLDAHKKAPVVWMLGSHPLRLRWFVSWRDRLFDYIRGQLDGNLNLSQQHPGFLRERMADWSAHRYPSAIAVREGLVHLPAREMGGCECYVASGQHDEEQQDVVDAEAIKALVEVARQYLATHPFKRDGLHVLFQLVGDGSVVQQFARQFTRRERDVRLTLHVLVDQNSRVGDNLIDSTSLDALLHTSQYSLFPLVEIRRHVIERLEDVGHLFEGDEHVIDLSIVPFLFSGVASVSMQIDQSDSRGQVADPVMVRPQSPVEDGTNLTIDLKPPVPDHLLDLWAMGVAVLKNKSFMVEGMYPRLTGSIRDVSSTLRTLLRVSRQVVTLDIGVTRAQLMSLSQDAPEVVNVTGGVGKNGDYSLVVASNQVHEALADRMRELLNRHVRTLPMDYEFCPDQQQIMSVTRKLLKGINVVGPQLVMQGAARSAHATEVLGRAAAQRWCARHLPGEGEQFWIALDDHDDWFVGPHADMLRATISMTSEGLRLDLLICESKFTSQGSALVNTREELVATASLLGDVLGSSGRDRLDRDAWYSVFVQALGDAPEATVLKDSQRIALLKGEFVLGEVSAMGFIWRMGQEPKELHRCDTPPIIIRAFDARDLWEAIGGVGA